MEEIIVFTNGCFDIIHPGHIELLTQAKALGTRLIVGINSDESVRRIKGPDRPIFGQNERAAMLLALESVDEVLIFNEQTPELLIREVSPDVLVKGGDWKTDEIVGADFVTSNGGKVVSLPLFEGYSTSAVIDRFREGEPSDLTSSGDGIVERSLRQHLDVFEAVRISLTKQIYECAKMISKTFKSGGKILICGNGGSAADAQHIAAEFVGRYEAERIALPAIALTTDTSALTALANDYDFERIFARQVEALARPGDCLLAISTSGDSANVIASVMTARKAGCRVIGLTGSRGKKLAALCDACIMVPSERTARIQEAHITIGHIWCELIDNEIAAGSGK